MDYFDQTSFVNSVCDELHLSYAELQKIHKKHENYAKQIYAIPFTIWIEPVPYKPIRMNWSTGHLYVPQKAKMVATIRDLILQQIGPDCFLNGFFPRYSEVILRSHYYIPTPKSFSRENKYLAEAKILRPIVTPDNDNVEKIINDAIKSFIIYDDAAIVSNITEKYYSKFPRIECVIFYNASPNETVHVNTMKQREERWLSMLKDQTKPHPVIQHLKKYFAT